MKKIETELEDELRAEYDKTLLRDGVRGKYAERHRSGTRLVRLDPDVAAEFADEKAVNEALRQLIQSAAAEAVSNGVAGDIGPVWRSEVATTNEP